MEAAVPLAEQARRLPDTHHWLDDEHTGGARTLLRDVTAAAEAVLDEFEKVQALRAQAAREFIARRDRLPGTPLPTAKA